VSAVAIDDLRFHVASMNIIIGMMMDYGVIWHSEKDNASMIGSGWSANFWLHFTQVNPGA
jgi:hypothetical protein